VNMIRQLWFASLWIAIVVFLGVRVDAAEIGWDGAYEGNPIPYEQERWPLGSRPSVGTCDTAFIIGEIKRATMRRFMLCFLRTTRFSIHL
jgi:hypothetical protein